MNRDVLFLASLAGYFVKCNRTRRTAYIPPYLNHCVTVSTSPIIPRLWTLAGAVLVICGELTLLWAETIAKQSAQPIPTSNDDVNQEPLT